MPEPLMNGTFSIYETPDGGFHIAYQPEGDEETRHIAVPAMLVKMARASANGKVNPFAAVKGLLSLDPHA